MNHIAIFESQNFDVREKQIDEERNQESRPEEKGSCQEEEVALGRAPAMGANKGFHSEAPVFRGLFFFGRV